jgi:hypothetical protein
MICADEGQREIASTLGVEPVQPVVGRWRKPVYSCRYAYAGGSMTLSVRELPDVTTATAYYGTLQRRLGASTSDTTLGQGTATTNDGSVLVVKDNKVLDVDARALPARFGRPAVDRDDAALETAITVMGCWTGA